MPIAKGCTLEAIQKFPGRIIRLPEGTYNVSTGLFPAPDTTYRQMLKMVPEGYRPSALETVRYALQREKELKKRGKDPRKILDDSLFDRYVDSDNPKWERTGAFFRAPKGKKKIGAYVDKDGDKRYARGVRFGIYDKIVSDDIRLPLTQGGKIVAWDDNGLPAEISTGNEPHVWHLSVNEEEQEVGVILRGDWCSDEGDWCLNFSAAWSRSDSNEDATFRIVQGSIEDYEMSKLK